MTDRTLMSIGMFSQASLLSVNALRSYHQSGLLVPASIDPSSGYRSYDPGQLADAAVLRRLRGLDLPLRSVGAILKARDPEVTRKVLAAHELEMQEKLLRVESVIADLQRAIVSPNQETPVRLEHHDHQHALALQSDVLSSALPEFLADVYPMLLDCAQRSGAVVIGEAAALYRPCDSDDLKQFVTAFFPIASPVPIAAAFVGIKTIELPARTMAVITHGGGYELIADSYAALGAWVAYHAEPSGEDIREIYSVTISDSDDTDTYITDICWPVSADPTKESFYDQPS